MQQTVVADTDVHEGPEGHDVAHHPLEPHAGLQLIDLGKAL